MGWHPYQIQEQTPEITDTKSTAVWGKHIDRNVEIAIILPLIHKTVEKKNPAFRFFYLEILCCLHMG